MKTFALLLLSAACAWAQPLRVADYSTSPEFSHVVTRGNGPVTLYNLNFYNASASIVYLQLYDSYTAAAPATNQVSLLNTTTELITATAQTTWTTGTRAKFVSTITLPGGIVSNKWYYLTQVSSSTWKPCNTFNDALVTNAVTMTSGGSGFVSLVVNPISQAAPVKVNSQATASICYNQGRAFNDGICAFVSSTDTNYTGLGIGAGLFDIVYSK
jgi:hypothetical protein